MFRRAIKYIERNLPEAVDYGKKDITFIYDNTEKGKAYIPLPDYSNWEITLDGTEVEESDDVWGITIDIPEGRHEIRLDYVKKHQTLYYFISLVFLAAIICIRRFNDKGHK